MLLLYRSAISFSFLAHVSRCLNSKYTCMFLVVLPSNFALFVLSFSLGFSSHMHGDHSPAEIIHLLSTSYMLRIELDASDTGENNTAIGSVKYLVSIPCPPAPYYLYLYWHLNPHSPASPNCFSTWFTISVNCSIRLYSPRLATLASSFIVLFPITINLLICSLDSAIALSLYNHLCLNSH